MIYSIVYEKYQTFPISAALGKSFKESMPNIRCALRFPTSFCHSPSLNRDIQCST